jgi:hypothetical protein
VCKAAKCKWWGGSIMKRYNSWLALNLGKPPKQQNWNEKEALKEMARF